MTADRPPHDPEPTPVERLLDRQRTAWQRGERLPVEALVESHPTLADDREGLLDLVWNEVDLRANAGDTPHLEEYRRRFPDLGDELARQFDVFTALGSQVAAVQPDGPTLTAKLAPAVGARPSSQDGYEILEKLGQGAMGVVYKALQRGLKRVVALKMILAGDDAGPEERARFRAEAEAAARLHHPNIVQIYEIGERDGRPFFSLEYCPGGGLDRKLAGTPLPPAEAARLVETLARAVHAAHRAHVVHRDLKPANVLLTADGTPKVADFGLAKRLDEAGRTRSGAVVGTPSYMAPEQAGGKTPVGPAADTYALGAILYECLTGRPPFKAASLLDTLQQVRLDDPVPPRRLQPKAPRDLETICLKCLQKDPKKRYSSAEGLAEDLRRQQTGEPITARPVGGPERAWRWGRRNPKDAALAAAGLLAAALGLAAYLWFAGARQAAEQDRRDRQARATTEAERKLTDAQALWARAKTAAVGEPHPWEDALSAARQVKDFIDDNAVDEATRVRVGQTLADVAAAKQEAADKAATAARDGRMKAELDKLAFDLDPALDDQGKGFVTNDPDYQQAFTRYGIDLNRPEDAASRIRASAIKPQLIAALDAWIPLLDDDEAGRRRVADLADRVSGPDDPLRPLRQALVQQDQGQLWRLAKQDVSSVPLSVLYDLALDLSHAGAFPQAVELLRPAQRLHPGDFALNFYLAHSFEKLNPPRQEEAIRFYTAAVAIQPNNSLAHYSLGNALGRRMSLDEAVAEYRTAVRLDPENADALANLGNALGAQARASLYARRPAAAAGLFKDAFTTAPARAVSHRFEAARAAALAGVGQGEDAAALTEEQRAGWRTQARDWLRADLAALTKQAASNDPKVRQDAAGQLRLWQGQTDFAGLRDEADLKKLPPDEQAAWRQFWADVAALAERATKP